MNFSDNTNKIGVFDRFSLSSSRDSIRSSVMSRGLSILFRTSSIFTTEEEKEMNLFDCRSEEFSTEPLPISTPVPQPNSFLPRIVSAPPRLPYEQAAETEEESCSSEESTSTQRRTSVSSADSTSSLVEELGQWDIICGRNSGGFHCVGNRRFRITVLMNMQKYLDAPTREQKTQVIKSIVHILQDEVGARFLRKVNKTEYKVLNDKEVRNKVAHTMRDLVQEHKKNDEQRTPSPKLAGSPLQSRRKFQQVASFEV